LKAAIIVPLVLSAIFWVLFALWEWKPTSKSGSSFFHHTSFFPSRILRNPTATGGMLMIFFISVMASMNWQYFAGVYLVVVRKVNFTEAAFMARGYQIGFIFVALITGILMKYVKRYRIFVWVGISVYVIGVGLMIPAREPSASEAFVVASQTVAGVGGGMASLAAQVAITGAVKHQGESSNLNLY
jgi:Na+/melibiose symporter-like transporter